MSAHSYFSFFFFNDTATTEIYTLSLHDALPISDERDTADHVDPHLGSPVRVLVPGEQVAGEGEPHREQEQQDADHPRSEEHTSELQSRLHLVCRLLLEKKKTERAISLTSKQNYR